MSIKWKFEKSNIGKLIIVMIFAAVLYVKVGCSFAALIGFGLLYFLIKGLEIEIEKPLLQSGITAVMLGAGSIFTTHLIQYLLLDAELRAKITSQKMQLNVLCCLVI